MTPPDKAPSPPPADPTDKRIKKRLAIAGGVVVAALAAAALLTSQRPKVDTSSGTPQTSSGIIVNKDASGHVIDKLAASSALASPPPVASAPAAHAATPASPTPGLPSSPDTGRTPALAAVGPAQLLPPPPAPPVKLQQPASPPPMTVIQKKELPLTTSSPQAPSKPTAPAAAPAKPEGSSIGYQLQLGLFNSTENADKLVKALKDKGIEAHTETRVTVGPYRSRAEADEAIAMLKGFGYAPLLQPAVTK